MALVVGDTGCTTGLAKRYYDLKKARAQASSSWSKMSTDQQNQLLDGLKNDCYDQATAVVAEIVTNASVTASVTGTAAVTTAPGAAPVTGSATGTVA